MGNLKIDIKNCYGIGKLETEIGFNTRNKAAIIYAPNGMMKTSLTKTIRNLLNNENPKDEIFQTRQSSASITIDGNDISLENLYIFDNEKEESASSISTFLANKELKKKYDDILSILEDSWSILRKKIISDSRSSDCQSEILKAFSQKDNQSIYECLLHIKETYFKEGFKPYDLYSFKYNDIFDKSGKVKNFIDENLDIITEYFKQYQTLMHSSSFFSEGEDSFGTYQANTLHKAVSDNRYFHASHKLILKDGTQISNQKGLEDLLNEEIKKVLSDKNLKRAFDKIDKKLRGNNELRTFQDTIQSNPEIIPLLLSYEDFRCKTLLGYINNNIKDFFNLINLYTREKTNIDKIIKEANKSIDKWNDIINLYNTRFFVPFEVVIKNQSDIILNQQTATLGFLYHDVESETIETPQNQLMKTLSLGEQRAFHILQNIFEIEAKKTSNKKTLIVMDDIADSFDYKNKYAIIEYLADLSEDPLFSILILTHNFDFYRTVVSRLNVHLIYFADKKENRTIKLCEGIYKTDILKNKFIKNFNNKRSFIGLIPFVRNIVEYTKGDNNDYKLLTACLHIKPNTSGIKMEDLYQIFKTYLYDIPGSKPPIDFGGDSYLESIYKEAEDVLSDLNEVELANKLILSMAIRLKAETYLLHNVLTEEQKREIKPNNNQTGELVKILKKYYLDTHKDLCLLMNKVLMLTSENIHINNFMFEPLVDISSNHLKQLYNDVKAL